MVLISSVERAQAHPNNDRNGSGSISACTNGSHYEAVLRISEALSAPARLKARRESLERLNEFLAFVQFYIILYKENSTEIKWSLIGSDKNLIGADAWEQQRCRRVCQETAGGKSRVYSPRRRGELAARMGVDRTTPMARMKKSGIDPHDNV